MKLSQKQIFLIAVVMWHYFHLQPAVEWPIPSTKDNKSAGKFNENKANFILILKKCNNICK